MLRRCARDAIIVTMFHYDGKIDHIPMQKGNHAGHFRFLEIKLPHKAALNYGIGVTTIGGEGGFNSVGSGFVTAASGTFGVLGTFGTLTGIGISS